jgi:hypothetical protein
MDTVADFQLSRGIIDTRLKPNWAMRIRGTSQYEVLCFAQWRTQAKNKGTYNA